MVRAYLFKIVVLILLTEGVILGQNSNEVHQELDSLKRELSTATDSLVVADLCFAIYEMNTFGIMRDVSETPSLLFRALRIYETTTEFTKLADVHNALGGFYYNRDLLDQAREHWSKSSGYYQKAGDNFGVAKSYNNLSLTYPAKDSLKVSYLLKAIEIGDARVQGSAYNNLSDHYLINEDFAKAEEYLLFSIKTGESIGRTSTQQAGYYDLGSLKKKQGKPEEAIAYIEKSLTFDAIRSTDPSVIGAYELLAELYESKNEYDKAFYYQKLWMGAKDSLFNAQVGQELLSLTTEYETEKKELTITSQQSKIDLFEKESQLKNQLFTFILLMIFVTALIIYLWKSRQSSRNGIELQKVFARDLIKNVEEERKRISNELHDSVGQQLILLKNQAKMEGKQAIVDTVASTLEEVRSITRDLHPAILDRLGLKAALEEMIRKLDENTDIFFSTELIEIDNLFSPDDQLNVYRIVQEAFNNVLKHSNATSAKLSIDYKENNVIVTIQDNGHGFKPEVEVKRRDSLGLKTIQERITMLNGKVRILSGGVGTRIILEIPK